MKLGDTPSELSPKEEYGDLENLFQWEGLEQNFDEVKDQLETIEALIRDYIKFCERYETDLGMEIYVDECADKIDRAFESFTINGKVIDIRELSDKYKFERIDIYNEIVVDVNRYIELFMIGTDHLPLVY